jgi:hypothetical protein
MKYLKNLKKITFNSKAILGALLFIPLITLFLMDRMILMFLIWKESPSISDFFQSLYYIEMAVYRVSVLSILTLIYYIIF